MASNLITATRDIWKSSCRRQLAYGMPLLSRLLKFKKVKPGGLQVAQNVETVFNDDLVTEPGPRTALPGGKKDYLGTMKFNTSTFMYPLERSHQEKTMNYKPGDWQLTNLAKKDVRQGMSSIKIRMNKRIWGCAGDTELDAYTTYCQGIGSACKPDTTYGTVDRSSNSWAQPASVLDSATAYKTAVSLTRNWLRTQLTYLNLYAQGAGPIVIILGSTLYNVLKQEFESFHEYKTTGDMAAQGFRSMELDGYEVLEDPYLDYLTVSSCELGDSSNGCLMGDVSGVTYTGKNVVAILNLDTWEYRYIPGVAIDGAAQDDEMMAEITDYFDQSQIEGGQRKDLARIYVDGNLCCEQPNLNTMFINVT